MSPFLYTLSLPNINRFSQLFRCQNPEKNCNKVITKDPTTPQLYRYTTLLRRTMVPIFGPHCIRLMYMFNKDSNLLTYLLKYK